MAEIEHNILQLPPDRPPIFVSAGIIKTEELIREYAQIQELPLQVIGSFSENEHIAQGKRLFYYDSPNGAAYNAFQLANPGREAASKYLPESIKLLHDAGQKAIISITAVKGEDPLKVLPPMAEWAVGMGADGVELNGSCPNDKKDLLCDDHDDTFEVSHATRDRIGKEIYLTIKMAAMGEQAIRLYKQKGLPVDGVVPINAPRKLSPINPRGKKRAIDVNDGYAGQSGPVINGLARKNLLAWLRNVEGGSDFPMTNPDFDVWSVGGVEDGREIYSRVHFMGARLVGGAQYLYRTDDPESAIKLWTSQYRDAQALAVAEEFSGSY